MTDLPNLDLDRGSQPPPGPVGPSNTETAARCLWLTEGNQR